MVRIPSLRRSETAPAQDENQDGRVDERDGRASGDTTRATGSEATTRPPRTGDRDGIGTTDRADESTTYRSRAAGAGTAAAGTTANAADGTEGRGRTATIEQDRVERDRAATDRLTTDRGAGDSTVRDRTTDETAVHRPVTDRPAKATGTARPTTDDAGPGRTPGTEGEPEIAVVRGPKPRASLLATLGLITGVAAALVVLTGTLAGYGIGLGVLASLLSIAGISATGRRHVAGKSDALIGLTLGLGAIIIGILALTGQFAWPSTDADTVQRFREWLDSQFVDRV